MSSAESGPAKNVGTRPVSKAKLIKHDTIERENFDLVAKVVELINVIGWNDDDTYTFEDGERWAKFNPEGETSEGTS
jgi:hypothetical protein